jgi:hypothetical protein
MYPYMQPPKYFTKEMPPPIIYFSSNTCVISMCLSLLLTFHSQLTKKGNISIVDRSSTCIISKKLISITPPKTYRQTTNELESIQGAPEIVASVRYRRTRNLAANRVVGKLAAEELIEDGDVIYLEAGSTCYEIIPFLGDHKDLTIIVNSLYLMTRLGAMVQHKIVLIGGGGICLVRAPARRDRLLYRKWRPD